MLITIDNKTFTYHQPVTLQTIIKQHYHNQKIYAGIIDNHLYELNHLLSQDAKIKWVDSDSLIGKQIYERTLVFTFIVAVKKLYPLSRIKVEFTFQDGLFATIEKEQSLRPDDVLLIKKQMQKIIDNQSPIIHHHHHLTKEEAIAFFKKQHQDDKASLLTIRNQELVSVYEMEGIFDYFFGFMLPDASYLTDISLQFYAPGLRLGRYDVDFSHHQLFQVMKEYEDWGELMKVPTVAKMNEQIKQGKSDELMLMSEAMIEKKLSELASKIVSQKDWLKLILIAGPSSAGKTTFSKRLKIHLQILGLQPVTISMDDFYLNRELTPRFDDGSYDFENINAVDLPFFNETMLQLINQQPVYLPHYDFKTGTRSLDLQPTILKDTQILIVEGIHGLNPQTSFYIPNHAKMKIYINALTHLNFDDHNRITTSDYRLIRRIVRDYQFRGVDAKTTIARFQKVKNGEDQYIYPYQEEADAIFNTSMVYELAILKPMVQQLLSTITNQDDQYLEARRLYHLLDYFVAIKTDVPSVSILREFIGGSIFT